MVRVERQTAYIAKLNTKLANLDPVQQKRRVQSQSMGNQEKGIAMSVEELPNLNRGQKIKPTIF